MRLISKHIVVITAFGLAACASMQQKTPSPTPTAAQTTPGVARQVIIYIPQNDQAAVQWLKLFEKYPNLRMVVALSPRFQRFAKEPLLKEKVLQLEKAG